MDSVWGLSKDRRVNTHFGDRRVSLEMAGGRLVGVVRVQLFGRDERV